MVFQLVLLPYERGGREGWSKLQLAEWRKTMFGYVLTIKYALRVENYSFLITWRRNNFPFSIFNLNLTLDKT